MEKVMSKLVTYFNGKPEVEVHLILYGRKREIFFPIPEQIHIHKPEFEFNNKYRLLFTVWTLFFLRHKIKSLKPDTLLSFGEEWNNMVLLATLGLKYPVYVSDRAEPGKKRRLFQEFLRNKLYPFADGIIVQTDKAKKLYHKKFPNNKTRAISNPFGDVKTGQTDGRENIILSVGRLIETKHYDLLINMFSKVDNRNWRLVIVGGNAVKQNGLSRLQRIIDKKNLNDKVTLTGTVSDVNSWYRKSKIFAFTSSSEGFPNVIGEAMQNGLPVIAFDCVAGPSELIDNGDNGYLIPMFDTDEYIDRLKKLMRDDHLRRRMGEHSLKKIQDFSINKIGEKYYKFITEKL